MDDRRTSRLGRLTMRIRALEPALRRSTGTPEAPSGSSRLEIAETLLDQAEDPGLPIPERLRKLQRAKALLMAEAEEGAGPLR
jgi:hypothetical protein